MLVKVRNADGSIKTKNGKVVYREQQFSTLTDRCKVRVGNEGTLADLMPRFIPTMRSYSRDRTKTNTVKTNRKGTLGRQIYYQPVMKNITQGKGKKKVIIGKEFTGKVIKHIQETSSAIKRKTTFLEVMDKIMINKSKWHKDHPEFQSKRAQY